MDRQALKRITPQPLWAFGSNSYWWWRNRGRHAWARLTSPFWRQNLRRLGAFKDLHRGEKMLHCREWSQLEADGSFLSAE
jgi:hypothetical protein